MAGEGRNPLARNPRYEKQKKKNGSTIPIPFDFQNSHDSEG
jgi:hypothetical protein